MSLKSPFREDCLSGKVGLVTGGGTGLGFEIARQFGRHGASVCIMGRREAVLQEACKSLEAEGIAVITSVGDVRRIQDCSKAVQATVARFGRLDVLVNNAAGNFLAPVDGLSPNAFKTVFEIDAGGVFNCSTAALDSLKETYNVHGDASIINITASFQQPPFFQAHAAAAKMAVDSLTRSFSLEFADYGVRSNGISPGPVPATGASKLGGGDSKGWLASPLPAADAQGMPRTMKAGHPWDIAMMAVYLTSEAGSWVSGDTIVVDGGHVLRRGTPTNANGTYQVDRQAIKDWARARETDDKKKPKFVAGQASKL